MTSDNHVDGNAMGGFLMDVFGKGEQEDLTADQKKVLKGLAEVFKRAAVRAVEVFRKGTS